MGNWGDFCTYCGDKISGEFPRRCRNNHETYASPVTVAVALQPVKQNNGIGILAVQRGIEPYIGRHALPGGFVDNGESSIIAAPRELFEETAINAKGRPVYFSEDVGGSHNGKDPRSHTMYFYTMPPLNEQDINLKFTDNEVQKLAVLFLADDKTSLQNKNGDIIELCFATHHRAALQYLQSLEN